MRLFRTIFLCASMLGLAGCATEPVSNEVIEDQLSGPEFRTVETEEGVVVMLVNPLLFEFDSDELTDVSRSPIAYIARVLNTPGVVSRQVHVNGYTDSIGSEEYNLDLSERRAQAVAKELVYNQVAAERVLYKSFGKANPIAPNTTDDGADNPEGRTLNRRVEIVILNP